MYQIEHKHRRLTCILKQEVLDYLSQSMQEVHNVDKPQCIVLSTKIYNLFIWLIAHDKMILFFEPLDEREDCKISYSCEGNQGDNLSFKLEDDQYVLGECCQYNILSVEQAIEAIEDILKANTIALTGNWYSW